MKNLLSTMALIALISNTAIATQASASPVKNISLEEVKVTPCKSQPGLPCEVSVSVGGEISGKTIKEIGKAGQNIIDYARLKKNPLKAPKRAAKRIHKHIKKGATKVNGHIKKIFGW